MSRICELLFNLSPMFGAWGCPVLALYVCPRNQQVGNQPVTSHSYLIRRSFIKRFPGKGENNCTYARSALQG
ncbi:hypothetical protein B0T20DRAFT_423680 [Sordaria brevicollis]|uniref:Secreted protein n=1 Tax=Sordaria brevicollis TaxID=83679 RepID=A0AAE0U5J5_SORBR|nr:hypothetical protein B0T20DRAFT_423680 [Sordaria brevicollis]